MTKAKQIRSGLTMLEVLVVISIISVLLALILPAIQATREAARQTKCTSRLRQLGLAEQSYESCHGKCPPAANVSFDPSRSDSKIHANGWFYLFPFLGLNPLRRASLVNGVFAPYSTVVSRTVVPVFQCPSDTTSDDGMIDGPNGITVGGSYAANGQLFASFAPPTSLSPNPRGASPRLNRGMKVSVIATDGTSNVIMFCEKVAACESIESGKGGNARDFFGFGQSGVSFFSCVAIPLGKNSIGPKSRFKTSVSDKQCNPEIASTCHQTLKVVMADGSVQALSDSMDADLWWKLIVPDDGAVASIPGAR